MHVCKRNNYDLSNSIDKTHPQLLPSCFGWTVLYVCLCIHPSIHTFPVCKFVPKRKRNSFQRKKTERPPRTERTPAPAPAPAPREYLKTHPSWGGEGYFSWNNRICKPKGTNKKNK